MYENNCSQGLHLFNGREERTVIEMVDALLAVNKNNQGVYVSVCLPLFRGLLRKL